MSNEGPMIVSPHRVALVNSSDAGRMPEVRTRATRDRVLIQQWAAARGAQPATGESTRSGPPTTFSVNDGDAGIRFNFPGVALYRQISWEEWFEHFHHHDLTFVYEQDTPGQPLGYRWRLVRTSELRASATIV